MDYSAKVGLVSISMLVGFMVLFIPVVIYFDKWCKAGNADILEVTYDGPGRLIPKKYGAKGILHGAILGGWIGALLMPRLPDGYKETACFTVRYRDGREKHEEVVVGGLSYDYYIRFINEGISKGENNESEALQQTYTNAEKKKITHKLKIYSAILIIYTIAIFAVAVVHDRTGSNITIPEIVISPESLVYAEELTDGQTAIELLAGVDLEEFAERTSAVLKKDVSYVDYYADEDGLGISIAYDGVYQMIKSCRNNKRGSDYQPWIEVRDSVQTLYDSLRETLDETGKMDVELTLNLVNDKYPDNYLQDDYYFIHVEESKLFSYDVLGRSE